MLVNGIDKVAATATGHFGSLAHRAKVLQCVLATAFEFGLRATMR
jgi:hypothetical protein